MPFGLFFAAIYFALFCSVFGLRCALWPQSLARPTGVFILTCSLALAVGLFGRRRWARWLALTAAALLAPIALLAFYDQGGLLELIWMLGNLLVVMLLALPATGRDPRSVEPSTASGLGGVGWLALLSLVGVLLAVVALPSRPASAADGSSIEGALPVSARAPRPIEWLNFDEGRRRAELDGRPMLVTFVTDWCPYCQKMDRTTWKASSVIRRMQDMIAVRVDAEQESALAEQYGVRGYPAQLMLDGSGRTIARQDGYQSAGQMTDWLERYGAVSR